MKLDKEEILRLVDKGYININKHPNKDLYILNYTPKTQYEKYWNEITLAARGLIVDDNYNIVARPLKKFFNLEEHNKENIPTHLPFEVFDKLDGSLGIVFFYDNQWMIVTRGSFISDQAKEANKMLSSFVDKDKLNKNYTYIVEIIYPENKIVVDYGDLRDLSLLAIINTKTGEEIPYSEFNNYVPFRLFSFVKRYYDIDDIFKLKNLEKPNQEGFVIKFSNNFRIKVKFDEYVRLHKIITNVSNKTIWETLKNGNGIDQIIENVPDEFYLWVQKTIKELKNKYTQIELEGLRNFKDIIFELSDNNLDRKLYTKKEFALKAKDYKYPKLLFCMYDGKNYSEHIWNLIKPDYSKPFRDGYENNF